MYIIRFQESGLQMADSVLDHNALRVALVFQGKGLSVNWQLNQDSSIGRAPG